MIANTVRGYVRKLALLLVLTIAVPMPATSQSGPNGTLSGTVTDPSGAVMVGVQVRLKNPGTGLSRSIVTDESGRWIAAALPPGTYELAYEAPSFKTLIQEGVVLESAVSRTVAAQLELQAAPGQVITVVDNTLLTTPDTAATFRQLSANELLEVPTSTRSFTHLLTAEAGISADLPPVLGNSNGNISPSVNGTRTTSTSLQFNGVDATNLSSNEGALTDNIAPSPETLAEVTLQTSLYDASTGRSGGGNFQLVTRSGTNQWHGNAYWYAQNEAFNANDYFYNRDGIDKPRARRNEGGFTFGGPLVENKTFIFGGYQRTDAQTAFVSTAQSNTVLPEALSLISGPRTAANLAAAFRQLNPAFPLTEAQISPIAVNILNLRNPATGDYLVPAPRAGGQRFNDQTVSGILGGNPFIRQRNVFPAEFAQDQFTVKLDQQLSGANRLSGTFFFTNFPGLDPFPDPSSLASPVTLRRDDRNRTLAINDMHMFTSAVINEARFGVFSLNNTRTLDGPFLALTNDAVGVANPANFYDSSNATTRLGHYIFRNNLSNLSWGGPNDSFNKRDQKTYSFADTLSWVRGRHTLRVGAEYKAHRYTTNLPEEQATEFEKFENFTQFLSGVGTEADTQFGITDKSFRMHDISWFFADDWRVSRALTLNAGVRWDWFAWPTEKNGRIGNFDFAAVTDPENPLSGFLVPGNVQNTGFVAIDTALAATRKAENNHTLNGQDLNNFGPRFGFAYTAGDSGLVFRGGYGVFFDRPSAAFMNTVFSNYPFLREVEVTAPSRAVPLGTAYSQQDPTFPFNGYLPNRLVYQADGTYVIRDGTNVTRGANGSLNPIDLATGAPALGNVAETFEFRAVDRNLRTPYVQQWNLGFQYGLGRDFLIEARYTGTKGTKLLQATAFNQGFDLNDPNTPDNVFGRLNRAYEAAYQAELARTGNVNILRGPLHSGSSERERGVGVAFGFPNLVTGQAIDYNLMRSTANPSDTTIIPFEARGVILGFNVPEAVLLQSSANSIYNALQLNLSKRMSRGIQFNTSYTWSKSIDNNSADPGSTSGGGKPDVPNAGFVVQGDQRNLNMNRSVSDFDRTHRFSASFVLEIPRFAGWTSEWVRGWQLSGFMQVQSGAPFSIFASEPEVNSLAHLTSLSRGSGGLYRLGFGRPNLNGTLDQLRAQGSDITEEFFDSGVLSSPLGGFGNLGRNVLRGPIQKRFDAALSKNIRLSEASSVQLRWEIFNVFNNVNFALPGNDLNDTADLGKITNTIGGPRVMQFGVKLAF